MRCLLFGILAFCPLSDGASLTWKEPPPSQVVQEAKDPVEHFSGRKLFEGTINATLRWCFNLTGLHFQSCAILFGGNTVALISSSVIGTPPSYAKRFGFDWIPNQHLMKLFIFNVSMKDSGTFSCRVTADSLDRFSEFHFKSHVQVDVVGTTSTPSTTASTIDEREGTTRTPSTTAPTIDEQEGSASTLWVIIGFATGGFVLLAILSGVFTWWVHKQRKRRKDFKIHNSYSDLERHDGVGRYSQVQDAYAQSGPPVANGTDRAAEQQIETEAATPTHSVVDKSKKGNMQADERPPEYAVVDKSQKKEKQEAAAMPTYAAVDKSKKKKKSHEEVPAAYAEVDKSKKKKIDDKNRYENLDEPKKEKKPGELLYADLGDCQNPSMPAVSISPQPLPAIKKADPYERTDYASSSEEMPPCFQMTAMETLE